MGDGQEPRHAAPMAPVRRPVRSLSADVARKIAAGEVIDRPAAIVRELMDNAVDSGADDIAVEIAGGGIEKIRVADNGCGMTREDLVACARPHATSKIVSAEDLLSLTTLGFRGEALSSIAAVSRLLILSGTNRMRASLTEDHIIEAIPLIQNGKGTVVQSEALFEHFPARRIFLKRPASETMLCRETFVEKALPRTDIAFRLTIDGTLRYDLPKQVSLAERFVSALELKEHPDLFFTLSNAESGGENAAWRFSLIIGEPSIWRNDRKHLFIYVNGRRVQEYALVQAIEYGCQGFFPNGTHPVAALFVTIDASLVDFNIHPAKKEVRFKDSSALHHGVSSTVRAFFRSYGIRESRINDTTDEQPTFAHVQKAFEHSAQSRQPLAVADSFADPPKTRTGGTDMRARFFDYDRAPRFEPQSIRPLAEAALAETTRAEDASLPFSRDPPATTPADFRFIGNALGTFLLAQVGETLYCIDQHAAHERLLFDKLRASGGENQQLLVPYGITTEDSADDDYLLHVRDALKKVGFTLERVADGRWEVSTVPIRWNGTEADIRDALLAKRTSPDDLLYKIAAMTACKAACKDGTVLDRATSEQLAKDALALPDPHCPHGRPVWTTLSKEFLFARVRRTR